MSETSVRCRQSGPLLVTSYTWDAAASLPVIVQETTNESTTSYVYGLDMLSATDNNDVTTYFLQDGLGSTTGLTDDDGSLTDTYAYDVFGAMKSQTGTSANAWRFTGELNDSSVARSPYYLRARYYDPALGRFLSQDPWPSNPMNPQTLNRYLYALNDPARFTDPNGYLPGLPSPGDIKKKAGEIKDKAGEIGGEVVDTCSSVVGGAADWTAEQAGRAGAWLSTCNWGKIGAGAVVVAAGAFVMGTGGFVAVTAAASASSATTGLGIYEGLEIATMTGLTAGAGGGIIGLGGFAMSKAGCGEQRGQMRARGSWSATGGPRDGKE